MRGIASTIAIGLLALAVPASAQDTPTFIFAQYYRCNQAVEAQADEVIRGVYGPIVQKHIDAGHLTGWSWLAHSQGGAWRRILVAVGTDLGVMMDARQAMVEELTGRHADATQRLASACSSHDDYIWQSVALSAPNPNLTAPASLSTYYVCDVAREGRVNQIFTEVLAPVYEKHRAMGHVVSWGFYAHRSGGPVRRLETFSGANHKTLLEMQAAILQEANTNNPLAMNEFREICNSHSDYMWTNATTG